MPETFDLVIPRLLRPLDTGGRQIQPRHIHGDMWADKASTNVDTKLPVIYDGACLYAHNESESCAVEKICQAELELGLTRFGGDGGMATHTTHDWEAVYEGIRISTISQFLPLKKNRTSYLTT